MAVKKILIVEDTPKHRADAEAFFRGLEEKVEVVYATCYDQAYSLLYKRANTSKIDGAIVDIYMPIGNAASMGSIDERMPQDLKDHIRDNATNLEPAGVGLANILQKYNVPFVLNTAGYHHGTKYAWIAGLCKVMEWDLVDSGRDYSKDAATKNWEKAYQLLEKKI